MMDHNKVRNGFYNLLSFPIQISFITRSNSQKASEQ
jgi:hypothetical protein